MEELLNNPAIQAALVTVIVVGLTAFTNWLKVRFPTQVMLVEANWCYLQPLVEGAIAAAKLAGSRANLDSGVGQKILLTALSQFEATYQRLEGKLPSVAEMNAAQTELTDAINRALAA